MAELFYSMCHKFVRRNIQTKCLDRSIYCRPCPLGIRWEAFYSFQAQLAANRAQFHYDLPAGPFYGYNRPGAKPSQRISASASSRTTGAATAVQVRAGAATTWPPVSTPSATCRSRLSASRSP
jgi:hypothetical protein